jgi:hypothetical protein
MDDGYVYINLGGHHFFSLYDYSWSEWFSLCFYETVFQSPFFKNYIVLLFVMMFSQTIWNELNMLYKTS